uniref:Uncharacterized protein n=1 Tax=Mimiviridae sp. ChoanoV1 TaxID=2596887 RepID=A0A5B8IHL3_9VIRU|nr:hypothetical protein 2_77 [Mimiviridae sp. ChoanoV1]
MNNKMLCRYNVPSKGEKTAWVKVKSILGGKKLLI